MRYCSQTKFTKIKKSLLICASSLALVAGSSIASAQERQYSFDVEAQTLEAALMDVARQSGVQLMFEAGSSALVNVEPVRGRMGVEEALAHLLSGTDLSFTRKSGGVYVVSERSGFQKVSYGSAGDYEASLAPSGQDEGADQVDVAEFETIVVTATRRGVDLQDVPMAISALGSDTIDKRNLVGMDDYLRTLPGVSMQDRGAGQNSIVIRGISLDPQNEAQSAVGTYFADVPISNFGSGSNSGSAGTVDVKLVDIERIEVLRGPQGTLYGSGTMGGAVRIVPFAPNLEEVEGKVAARLSHTGRQGSENSMVQAVLNVPVVEDVFAVRGAVYRFKNSGFIKNVAASQSNADITRAVNEDGGVAQDQAGIGRDEYIGGRLTALWRPSDKFDVTLMYMQQEIEQDGIPEVNLNLAGRYEQIRLNTGPVGGRSEGLDNRVRMASLSLDYDLGWAGITSYSSWVDYEATINADLSNFLGTYYAENSKDTTAFVEELRLASQLDGPFQFVAGLYYEDKRNDQTISWDWSGDAALNPYPEPGLPRFVNDLSGDLKHKAIFGEFEYSFTDAITGIVGGRYFDYDLKDDNALISRGAVLFDENPRSTSESGSLFKAGLNYEFDNSLMYLQWSEGFRIGRSQGRNAGCEALNIETPDGVDSDRTENWELGVKTSFADGRVQLNAAAYRINWNGLPIVVNPAGRCFFADNAGSAKSEGVELELKMQMFDQVVVDVSASSVRSVLTADAPNVNGEKGDNLPGSADFNFSAGVQYDFNIGSYPGFSRIDFAYVGDYYNTLSEVGIASGGYSEVSAKVGMDFGQLSVDIFVENLTNQDALTWVETINQGGRAYRIRPRTFGMNAQYRF